MNDVIENRRIRNSIKQSPEKTLAELIFTFKNQFNNLLMEMDTVVQTRLEELNDKVFGTQNIRDIATNATRDELKDIREILDTTKATMLGEFKTLHSSMIKEIDELSKEKHASLEKYVESKKSSILEGVMSKLMADADKFGKALDEKLQEVSKKIATLKAYKPEPGKPGQNANPNEVASIVLKQLNSQPKSKMLTTEDVEKLLEAQKKDFERIIARLQTSIKQKQKSGGTSGGGGDIIRIDDFTGNGSNKVFTLTQAPRSIRKIMVHCSDFPNIYRPTTDFTLSDRTLTLTAAVDAPSDTATLIVQYVV
jgi:hypothetical protein